MRRKTSGLLLIGLFLISTFLPHVSWAEEDAASRLVINEVYYDVDSNEGCQTEWIEIFNPTLERINLEGFFLLDENILNKDLDIEEEKEASYVFPDIFVESRSFLIVAKSNEDFLDCYFVKDSRPVLLEDFKFGLNDGKEVLVLKDKEGGKIDDVIWGYSRENSHPGVKEGESLERDPRGKDTGDCSNDFKAQADPEPELGWSAPFNQVGASVEENEITIDWSWIKGKNEGEREGVFSHFEVFYTKKDSFKKGWEVKKLETSSENSFEESPTLKDLDWGTDYKIKLAVVEEFSDNGNSILIRTYSKTSTVSTKEKPEEDSSKPEEKIIPISKALKKKDGEIAAVKGKANVSSNIFGQRQIYIQDKKAGIQVYFYHSSWPGFEIGDILKIKGEISSVRGEKRIKIDKKEDIERTKGEGIKIERIGWHELGKNIGRLIRIKGIVSSSSGNTFYIKKTKKGAKKLKVYIKDSTKIDKPTTRKGYKVKIAGVLTKNNKGFKILPRFQKDLEVFSDEENEKEKEDERDDVLAGSDSESSSQDKKDKKQVKSAELTRKTTVKPILKNIPRDFRAPVRRSDPFKKAGQNTVLTSSILLGFFLIYLYRLPLLKTFLTIKGS